MNPIEISCIVLACTSGAILCGILLRPHIPEWHLGADTKSVIAVATGLVGTMAALVLGLLTASGKDSYDSQNKELIDLSANIVLLDRALAHFGPEAVPVRSLLHSVAVRTLDQSWSNSAGPTPQKNSRAARPEVIYDNIQALSPKSDAQRSIQSQALAIAMAIGKTRWLMFEQGSNSVATPFLVVLVSWLTLLFMSFGLLTPHNATAIIALLACAVSVSSAIFLILELYRPFEGLIQISDAPLRAAVAQLGQ